MFNSNRPVFISRNRGSSSCFRFAASSAPTQSVKTTGEEATESNLKEQCLAQNLQVSLHAVNQRVADICFYAKNVSDTTSWLIRAILCLDLTTLAGDDTPAYVQKLCSKAVSPLPLHVRAMLHNVPVQVSVAAVCVFPKRVADVGNFFIRHSIPSINVASVATGFPIGLYPLESKIKEIEFAVAEGATEIDVVIDRSLVLTQQWNMLAHEIKEMKKACGKSVHMKTILGVGECDTLENIYRASIVAMCAGSDFIKTSTGKEAVNATLPVGVVMCRAIRNYYQVSGRKVGFKPAGGIKTSQDVINWLSLVKCELGDSWLTPSLFRIGASSLLDDIVKTIIAKTLRR